MEFKTKFNKGDTVHFMMHNQPMSGVVLGIETRCGDIQEDFSFKSYDGTLIIYHVEGFNGGSGIPEQLLFASYEDLKRALNSNKLNATIQNAWEESVKSYQKL